MDKECFAFEKLDVYQRALDLAKQVYKVTLNLKTCLSWSDQLRRAATSIVLNLAEGSGRNHQREKKQFYYIARGSIFECVPLLELGVSIGVLSTDQRNELREQYIVIAKMVTKLIQSVRDSDN
jgi:four helix bundle protein